MIRLKDLNIGDDVSVDTDIGYISLLVFGKIISIGSESFTMKVTSDSYRDCLFTVPNTSFERVQKIPKN